MGESREIETRLDDIAELRRTVKLRDAQERAETLLEELSAEDLRVHRSRFAEVIGEFLPKRRRTLEEIFKRRLEELTAPPDYEIERFLGGCRAKLAELSDRHIYQWGTFYREFMQMLFADSMRFLRRGATAHLICQPLRNELEQHAEEIFRKGFEYLRGGRENRRSALQKAANGLQRFLELAIEQYSHMSRRVRDMQDAMLLRSLLSAVLSGILVGFGRVPFGKQQGFSVLPYFNRSWASYITFMSEDDLINLATSIEPGALRTGFLQTVAPVVGAIDELMATHEAADVALPILGQFEWATGRGRTKNRRMLSISIAAPKSPEPSQLMEVQCHMDPGFLEKWHITEAVGRDVDLLAGPLRADLQEWASAERHTPGFVLNTSELMTDGERARRHALGILTNAVSRAYGSKGRSAILTHNLARSFPLESPKLTPFFFVERRSVQRLLQGFERTTGVRLWCSVRRSGKTTACSDLSSVTGHAQVLFQTCQRVDPAHRDDLLIGEVVKAINKGDQLGEDFLLRILAQCAGRSELGELRHILILDEYETLFERLGTAASSSPELRYSVVQPLLNQMVALSQENLIVLVGQRPDAHYIIMDQNQLSAFVHQDQFPLFEHSLDSPHSEFRGLIRKVLTEQLHVDETFVDEVYLETGGHPYLTVNVLVCFLDWLIESRVPAATTRLESDHFLRFADACLVRRQLRLRPEYAFMRNAAKQALGPAGATSTPWLHAVYQMLRVIAEHDEGTFSCTIDEFCEVFVLKLGLEERLGLEAEQVLAGGSAANFFVMDGDVVSPRIRLLARLSAATTPGRK